MLKISQSLLKGLIDYSKYGSTECGLVFKAKYIDSRFDLFPPSDAQNLGAWFEYMATGSIPKNGAIPQPDYIKKKDAEGNPELGADYRLMRSHLPNFKNIMETYGFEILSVGEDVKVLFDFDILENIVIKYPFLIESFKELQVWLTGTLDIRVRGLKDIIVKDSNGNKTTVLEKGQVAIVDMKSSGLLDDKFSPFGWELDNLYNKTKITTQPIHYKFIEILKTGINPPFLFLLFNTKNENDCRIIDFRCDDSIFDDHKATINKAIHHLLVYQKFGYEARPSMAKCAECPLKEDCKFKTNVPIISVYNHIYQP